MSTQVETGQGYAPSAKKTSGSYLPWMIGAVVAAVAIAATLAISANNESDSQASSAAEISQAKRQQAQADRLTAAAVAAGAVTPELSRSAQAQADRLTGLAGQFQAPRAPVSEFSPERFRVPLESSATVSDFSPEAVRVPLGSSDAGTGDGEAEGNSGSLGIWHEPR